MNIYKKIWIKKTDNEQIRDAKKSKVENKERETEVRKVETEMAEEQSRKDEDTKV